MVIQTKFHPTENKFTCELMEFEFLAEGKTSEEAALALCYHIKSDIDSIVTEIMERKFESEKIMES